MSYAIQTNGGDTGVETVKSSALYQSLSQSESLLQGTPQAEVAGGARQRQPVLSVLCALVATTAVAGLVFSVMEESYLSGILSPLFPGCSGMYAVYAGMFVALFVLAVTGYFLLRLAVRSSFMAYGLVLMAMLGLSMALFVVGLSPLAVMQDTWGSIVWEEAATARTTTGDFTSALCSVQVAFACSGWQHRCDAVEPYNAAQSVAVSCPICSAADQLRIAGFTKTCAGLKELTLRYYFTVVYSTGLIIWLCVALSISYALALHTPAARATGPPLDHPREAAYEMRVEPTV